MDNFDDYMILFNSRSQVLKTKWFFKIQVERRIQLSNRHLRRFGFHNLEHLRACK